VPFALVTIGLLLIITGAKNTYPQFGAQLRADFTGPGNFTYWLVALGAVGAVGYIPKLRNVSTAFLALILVGMIVRNGGIFDKLTEFLQQGPIAPQPVSVPTVPSNSGGTKTSDATGVDTTKVAELGMEILPLIV